MWNDILTNNDEYECELPDDDYLYSPCDMCQGIFETEDLVHIKAGADDLWVCPDCEENYWLRISQELEEQDDNF